MPTRTQIPQHLAAVLALTLTLSGAAGAAPPNAARRLDTISCAPRLASQANAAAVIDIRGDIGARFESDRIFNALNTIAQDAKFGAVVLRIDSPGGDSYASSRIYHALRQLRTSCSLPMASFIGNVGTSGAYWIASAADEVYADPLSTVGSVGVMAVYVNEKEKLEREGVHHTVVRTGERKWPLMPYLTIENRDVDKIKSSLTLVLNEFVGAVQASRGKRLKLSVAALTTGEAWMGSEAAGLGLVDGASDVDSVVTRLLGAPADHYEIFDLLNGRDESPRERPATPSIVASSAAR